MPSAHLVIFQERTADNFNYRVMVCLGMLPKRNAISVRRCFKNTRVNRPWAKFSGRQRAWRLQLSVLRDRLEYQSYADSKYLSKVTASFFPLQPHLLAVGLRA